MDSPKQLLIIYNADSSIRGKLNYAYRKITSSSSSNPACAACDITHGGLSLQEVPGWREAKGRIEGQGVRVTQWHRDEVEGDVKEWISAQNVSLPTLLLRETGVDKSLRQVVDRNELASCAGDANKLVAILKEKNVLQQSSSL